MSNQWWYITSITEDWSNVDLLQDDPQVVAINDEFKRLCEKAEREYADDEFIARNLRDKKVRQARLTRQNKLEKLGVIITERTST